MPTLLGTDYHRNFKLRRYPLLVYVIIPLIALVLQAWLPRLLGRFAWFDLPLVVTVYFSLSCQHPIQGTLTGAALGLFEDALGHHAIGINGVAKTIAGFLAASVGARIDVENFIIRLMVIFGLSVLSSSIYLFINHVLLGLELEVGWLTELFKACGNTVIAVVLFPLLDRFQVRE